MNEASTFGVASGSDTSVRRSHPPGIETLSSHAQEIAIDVLARAFCENPLNRTVIGGRVRRRLRITRSGMRASLVAALGVAEITTIGAPHRGPDAGHHGVLVGFSPGTYPAPPPPVLVQLRCLFGQGFRVVSRWSRVHDALLAKHPSAPHAYLALLGVHPDRQGRGLGFRLLEDWLLGIDAIGAPAYLETDRREAIPFYQRAGFEVMGESEVLAKCIYHLRRDAK